MSFDKQQFENYLRACAFAEYGKTLETVSEKELWAVLSKVTVQELGARWEATRDRYSQVRQAHYFSAEFLVGRSLRNNLVNLGIYDEVRDLLAERDVDLAELLEQETDPGLGNGGLGRLAACFLDSCATAEYPVTGYGILYRYGLFKQKIENGFQKEYPDAWMEDGYPFVVPRREDKVLVDFHDFKVFAVPFDMPITGFGTDNVNVLRLWKAEPAQEFDFNLFNSQRFDDAMISRNRVLDICRVLYPNDTSYDGKVLRVRQQYFFVSASLQTILKQFTAVHGQDFTQFARLNSIQLNDTHPVLAIPELMRLLLDEYRQSWDEAWQIVSQTFAFTNHTILHEALEKWDIGIFQFLFPRIYQIIELIDQQFETEALQFGFTQEKIQELSPIHDGKVHMAMLAIYASYSINGVASIHTNLLKSTVFNDFYRVYPTRFNNKTNGVTPRRWLYQSNPRLSRLLTELSGSDAWVTDLDRLAELERFKDDSHIMRRLLEIKSQNKEDLTRTILQNTGIKVDSSFLFDVQVKRLHEYKRQLMNAFLILDQYYRLKEKPQQNGVTPVAYIFAAKAAPGYFKAKAVIKFISEVAKLVNEDSDMNDKMKVVFLQNYTVSLAEQIFPASDISEQISTVGKEASGTGNMKFMMNGALTLGTYDGANIEILEEVGEENSFMFGPTIDEFPATQNYYNSQWQYQNVSGLKRAVDSLVNGTFADNNTNMFSDLYNSLIAGSSWEGADPFYVLGDFEAYRDRRREAHAAYRYPIEWAEKCWVNICRSGRFSSDRTIGEYASGIWKVEKTPIVAS
ncbi:MAG TPA: glycogen/starch/alpha-glucan phosphorylase [Clostridiaceae bacterium]|jgi:starch phosphorylase|nr:glycogen/starch/alpha-glucan phosphorylase [Clostridiaceae bacterium]